MINILIRTSQRPKGFNRTLDSIKSQTYKDIKVIVSYDDEKALSYIPDEIEKIRVYKHDALFFYDNYCNNLKSMVNNGWFFFLDDGDVLFDNHVISRLSEQLKNQSGVICQFSRKGRLKPSNELIKTKSIIRGKIGMPCLVLHHKLKNIADFDGSVSASDFTWIKKVSRKVRLKFIPLILVEAGERDNGKMELSGED